MNSDSLLKYFSSFGFFDEIKNQIASNRSEGRNFVISPLYGAAEGLFISELKNDEAEIMEKLEVDILKQLGFANPYK